MTVKAYSEQGNHELTNVVGVTGEIPVCGPNSPLCTNHHVPEPPAAGGSGTPDGKLASTGAEVGGLMWLGAALLAGGGLMLFASRQRKAIASE